MIVFKTYLKVLKSSFAFVALYTVLLVVFGAFNMSTSENQIAFSMEKPNVLIVNEDENSGISKGIVDYFTKNANIIEVDDSDNARMDALFYRDVNYIIYIPKDFGSDFLAFKEAQVSIESTGDYNASLADMMLERYLSLAKIYREIYNDEEEIVEKVEGILSSQVEVELSSQIDSDNLSKMAFYYNFANYSILAGCVYVVAMVLSSFKNVNIRKRTVISSMNYKKFNRQLFLSNALFVIGLWLIYVILSFILIGSAMVSLYGLLYIVNALVFSICALSISFLIGNAIKSKEAISGIVNVIALGSSFLCGAFVPMEWLPDSVLKIAYVLPSYYYIKSNDLLKSIEVLSFNSVMPLLINMLVIFGFTILFVVLSNVFAKKNRKIN